MTADAGTMSSRDYEREAEASRHRLAGSLRELNDRLTPGNVFDEVLTYAKGGGGTFLSALSQAARDNPVPSMLIGAGLLMFLSEKTGLSHLTHQRNQNRGRSDRYGYGDAYGGDGYMGDGYGNGSYDRNAGYDNGYAGSDNRGGMGRRVRNAAGQAMDTARGAAGSMSGAARRGAEGVTAAVAGAAESARAAAANVGEGMANTADNLRHQAEGMGGTLRDTAMGMGGAVRDTAMNVGGTVRDTAMGVGGTVRDTAFGVGGTVRDAAGALGERVAGVAQQAPRKVSETVVQARDSMMSLAAEQPIVVGALGLAIGAVIAAALPKTQVEDELMGEASDNIKQAVGALANEQMANAGTMAAKLATDVVSDMGQVAERQGVTPQAAAGVVRTATDRIKQAVGLPDNASGGQTTGKESTTF